MNLYRIEDKDKDKEVFYAVADDFQAAVDALRENVATTPVSVELVEDDVTIQGED